MKYSLVYIYDCVVVAKKDSPMIGVDKCSMI